jgi:hypothetical protein
MTFAANALSVAQYRAIAKKGGDDWEITKVYVCGLGAGMAAATYA